MAEKTKTARLAAAVAHAHKNMRCFRESRKAIIEQLAGDQYGDRLRRTEQPTLLNILGIYGSVVSRSLISKDPRLLLTTYRDGDKPAVRLMQDWSNQQLEDMRFADTLQRIVWDSLISIGIGKVGLSDPGDSARGGWVRKVGTPFIDHIDLDDFVVDLQARTFPEVGFIGHRFYIPLDAARSQYSKKIEPAERKEFNEGGDERTDVLGQGETRSDVESYEDYACLWEIYCPRAKRIKVFDDELMGENGYDDEKPLEERPWVGPPEGPYHILSYGLVPGNLMPKGPMQDLSHLHVGFNCLLAKLLNQAQRQKSVLPYAGADTRDVDLLNSEKDGHGFRCNNPEALKEVRFGGPDAANYQFSMALKELADWAGGNISIMGGLSPQSKTATQDKMLNENSTRMLADMGATTVKYVTDVTRALCWYWWHDPYKVMRAGWSPQGAPGLEVERVLTPLDRVRTPWGSMRLRIDPYSMQHQTPDMRLNFLNGVVKNLMPLQPLLAQQGYFLDMGYLLQKTAEYGDMPDVTALYRVQEPLNLEEQGGGGGMPHDRMMPTETTRTYDRRSTGGDTPQGRMAEIGNEMAGAAQGGSGGESY